MKKDGSPLIGGPQSGKRVVSDCMTLKFPKMEQPASFHGETEPHYRSDFDSDVYTKCPIPGIGHIYVHSSYSNVSVFEAILDVIEQNQHQRNWQMNNAAIQMAVHAGAAAEREACAKVCDEVEMRFGRDGDDLEQYGANQCAAAIRARG